MVIRTIKKLRDEDSFDLGPLGDKLLEDESFEFDSTTKKSPPILKKAI